MAIQVPIQELKDRLDRFRLQMDRKHPEWEYAAIFSNINLYYFTGTMQDGVFLIPRLGDAVYWVRRSYERALEESPLPSIRSMTGFRDPGRESSCPGKQVYLETEAIPFALVERFRKHLPFREIRSLDATVASVRATKSSFELSLMEQAGSLHQLALERWVPDILEEGMSEAALGTRLYARMVEGGHQGIVRFGSFNTEIEVGQLGFGENSLYPTRFDGPGGCRGISPAAPVLGSPDRRLRKGDLVFIDNSCGIEGYQTDKTMTYMFGESPSSYAREIQDQCVDLEHELAALLRPGNTPSQIYTAITEHLPPAFKEHFMGFGNRRVRFLGHGVGLVVDEWPAIAKGFDEPLREGMTIALEPKKGIEGIGMVGIENTYLVTPGGGRSITGTHPGLMGVE